jgi:Ca2+-dependent lipid-binding protein
MKSEKGNTPCKVRVQIVSAMDLKTNDPNKISPTAWIFVRQVLGDKIGRKVFSTATLKKTPQPYWNELFQVYVIQINKHTIKQNHTITQSHNHTINQTITRLLLLTTYILVFFDE